MFYAELPVVVTRTTKESQMTRNENENTQSLSSNNKKNEK